MEDSAVYGVFADTLRNLPNDAAYVGVAMLLLAFARFLKDRLTPFSLRIEMTERDNPALGISVAGYYVGVLVIIIGAMSTGPSAAVPLLDDLLTTAGYAILGILLLNVSRLLVDRVLLRDFSTVKEIIEDRNVGTGAVEMGAYVASALIIAGAIQGEGGGPHTAMAFYGVGQLGLLVYGHIYRALCRYDLHAEIERDNVAAGVALGLNLIAIGLISMKGIAGDFLGWEVNLSRFAAAYVVGLVILVVLRFVIDWMLLPGASLQREIAEDRNLNAAWIEGSVLAGIAGVLVVII